MGQFDDELQRAYVRKARNEVESAEVAASQAAHRRAWVSTLSPLILEFCIRANALGPIWVRGGSVRLEIKPDYLLSGPYPSPRTTLFGTRKRRSGCIDGHIWIRDEEGHLWRPVWVIAVGDGGQYENTITIPFKPSRAAIEEALAGAWSKPDWSGKSPMYPPERITRDLADALASAVQMEHW